MVFALPIISSFSLSLSLCSTERAEGRARAEPKREGGLLLFLIGNRDLYGVCTVHAEQPYVDSAHCKYLYFFFGYATP